MGQQVQQEIEPQYEVLHIEKRKMVSFGLERHIDRGHTEISEEIVKKDDVKMLIKSLIEEKFCPDNADEERSALNVELIPRPTMKVKSGKEVKEVPMKISQVIKRRVKEATGTDQVDAGKNMALEVLLSGSPKTMCAMSEKTLASWCKDSIQWVKDTFGEENVVSATLHRDEKTPHIHVFVVPIVSGLSKSAQIRREIRKKKCEETGEEYREYKVKEKLRLSADDVMGSDAFSRYHDTYSQVTIKYGLQRGVRAEKGSKKRHQTSEDYNRELARDKEKLQNENEALKKENSALQQQLETLKQERNDLNHRNSAMSESIDRLQGRIAELVSEEETQSDKNHHLRVEGSLIKGEIDELHNKMGIIQEKHDKAFDFVAGLLTKDTVAALPVIASEVLQEIVREDIGCELGNFGKNKNGDYILNASKRGERFVLRIDQSGKVFFSGSHENKQLPNATGKRFIAFFQVVKNPVFYDKLKVVIKERVTVQGMMKGSQAPAAAAPSQVGRGGHGGGGHRPDEPKRFANISFGHGGGKDTPGASSSEKGESVYDEAVRKGEEERQKRRGPDF